MKPTHSPIAAKHGLTCQKGFTLIEMAIVMVVAGMVISIMLTVLPTMLKTGKIKESRAKLAKYDYSLQGYAMANFSLPWADADGNGTADNGTYTGTLPYLTLGLTKGTDVWGNLVKYTVYGAAGNPYTLTQTTDKATLSAALSEIPKTANFSTAVAYITSSDTCAGANSSNSSNVAYVIASGGPKDLDGNNGFFDLCNGSAGAGYNEDEKIQADNYDDLVKSMGALELLQKTCSP